MEDRPVAEPHPFSDVDKVAASGVVVVRRRDHHRYVLLHLLAGPHSHGAVCSAALPIAADLPVAERTCSLMSTRVQQDPVSWLFAEGITTGTSATEFSPGDPVVCCQMATFLYRYQGSLPVTVDASSPPAVARACDGFDSLFIGHSWPMAEEMAVLAPLAGFDAHTQEVVFSGGATGSPEGLWLQNTKRATIQAELDEGDIDPSG